MSSKAVYNFLDNLIDIPYDHHKMTYTFTSLDNFKGLQMSNYYLQNEPIKQSNIILIDGHT